MKHISPFRFPGGKSWMVPRVAAWLNSLPDFPAEFLEPFAGGASVGLFVAKENLAKLVTLVEIDPRIAAVWRVVINGEGNLQVLINRILSFRITKESVEETLSKRVSRIEEQAFQTLLRNRVNRGGIMAQGAGQIRRGENGRGIGSRWYPETLCSRLEAISQLRTRLRFVHGDGMTIMKERTQTSRCAFFIDPPYTAGANRVGARLYTYSELDHEELFRTARKLKGPFLMTYSDDAYVGKLVKDNGFEKKEVAMKTTHHTRKKEILISRNLEWTSLI